LFGVQSATTRFGRVLKQTRFFNPGFGPPSRWREEEDGLSSDQERINTLGGTQLGISENGLSTENVTDTALRKDENCEDGFEQLEDVPSSDCDSDSDDSDKTEPMSPMPVAKGASDEVEVKDGVSEKIMMEVNVVVSVIL
jgi:hypothetical protein